MFVEDITEVRMLIYHDVDYDDRGKAIKRRN